MSSLKPPLASYECILWGYAYGGNFCVMTKGATHMVNIVRLNGVVHLYVVHTMSEPEIINMIEGIGLEELVFLRVMMKVKKC